MAKETVKVKKSVLAAADRRKKTQIVVTRMLIMAALNIIGICALVSIRREAMVELDFVLDWLTPLTIAFGVLSVGSGVWLGLVLAKKVNTSSYPVTPAMAFCTSLFCLIACLVYKTAMGATFVLVSASVIATVLFLVYCLYMHIFYR
ncbi:MAG: hypothetical protein E7662_10160 [Ruminococcaceae bacterium]|nr:hypothetical protein [Oscillospiraceae bacterium]